MEDPITNYGLTYCPKCHNGYLLPVLDRFTDPNTKQKRVQVTLVCVGDGETDCTHQIANPASLEDYLSGDALTKVERMIVRGPGRDG